MVEYGVNVTNKFAFLGDDEDVHDPQEALAKAEKESKEKPKTKDVKKPVVVPQPVQEKKVTAAPQANKENAEGRRNQPRKNGPGGNFKGPRENRGPRRQNNDENAPPGNDLSERFGENRPPRQNRNRNFEHRNRGEGENRGENRSYGRGNQGGWQKREERPPRQPRTEGGDNVTSGEEGQQVNNRPPRDRPFRDRPNQRGPRTGGPPRGDRMSGSDKTGVRPVPKKDGFGKGNWGTEQDELVGETEPHGETDLNKTTADLDATQVEGDNANNENAEGQLNGEQEAEKIQQLTLEEWKSQQQQKQPQFNIRKPGEGADQKIYKNLVPIKKEKVEKDSESEEEQSQVKREPRERPLNIEVSFSDSTQRNNRGNFRDGPRPNYERRDDRGHREDRGDRRSGGGPGRGGRGGGRGYNQDGPSGSGRRQQNQGFNLTAESFPALGAGN